MIERNCCQEHAINIGSKYAEAIGFAEADLWVKPLSAKKNKQLIRQAANKERRQRTQQRMQHGRRRRNCVLANEPVGHGLDSSYPDDSDEEHVQEERTKDITFELDHLRRIDADELFPEVDLEQGEVYDERDDEDTSEEITQASFIGSPWELSDVEFNNCDRFDDEFFDDDDEHKQHEA